MHVPAKNQELLPGLLGFGRSLENLLSAAELNSSPGSTGTVWRVFLQVSDGRLQARPGGQSEPEWTLDAQAP